MVQNSVGMNLCKNRRGFSRVLDIFHGPSKGLCPSTKLFWWHEFGLLYVTVDCAFPDKVNGSFIIVYFDHVFGATAAQPGGESISPRPVSLSGQTNTTATTVMATTLTKAEATTAILSSELTQHK